MTPHLIFILHSKHELVTDISFF